MCLDARYADIPSMTFMRVVRSYSSKGVRIGNTARIVEQICGRSRAMTQYDKNCESFLTYMKAVKNVAQDVIHAYDTADEGGNVAWEIIEDIMQGLIDVFIDWFPDEETEKKTKVEQRDVTWADLSETRRELGMVQERNMKNFVSINQVLDKIEKLSRRVDDLDIRTDDLERWRVKEEGRER